MKLWTHGPVAHEVPCTDARPETGENSVPSRSLGRLGAAMSAGWSQRQARQVLLAAGWTALTCITIWTAVAAKEGRLGAPLLAEVGRAPMPERVEAAGFVETDVAFDSGALGIDIPLFANVDDPQDPHRAEEDVSEVADLTGLTALLDAPAARPSTPFERAQAPAGAEKFAQDASIRWFNGRPIRPVREMWMTVTAYSPDAASCGDSADGITATLHHVTTNGHALVAADPEVLPYGSMITVPGYDQSRVVPVLDCGGAIKGRRLDVLFPTHAQAVRWGVQRLKVTVWGYADGGPRDNPRALR